MHLVDEVFAGLVACRDACATRRQLLLAPLPLAVLATAAQASKINPSDSFSTIRPVPWIGDLSDLCYLRPRGRDPRRKCSA